MDDKTLKSKIDELMESDDIVTEKGALMKSDDLVVYMSRESYNKINDEIIEELKNNK